MSITLEQAIKHAEDVSISAIGCECRDEHRQLAEWLRELVERRKADSCDGCVREFGKTYLLVCASCKRRYADLYEPERRTDG